jgi:hypothetical protein
MEFRLSLANRRYPTSPKERQENGISSCNIKGTDIQLKAF